VPVDVDRRPRCPRFHAGRAPGNKGLRYPADPPKVEAIIALMRTAGDGAHGRRLCGLIVIMWRAGLRFQEALALSVGDLDHRRGSLLIRRGKGGRRREVGMDASAWEQLQPWLERRRELQVGPLLCVITARRADANGRRPRPRRVASHGRLSRGAAPLRAAPAAARSRGRDGTGGVPLFVIQRQLGHSNLGITSVYLQGIDSGEIIETVHARRAPMLPVSAALRL
jgi:integrase